MKLAIMQPYFLPYIGYFQLVKAVEKFIFYDDVNYIKNGWINRNRILLNGQAHYITIYQKNASPNKLINEIEIIDNRKKLKKTMASAYGKAPYFKETWALIERILNFETASMSKLAAYSIIQVSDFLGIKSRFEFSSQRYSQTSGLKSENRLVSICKINGASVYINPIGGRKLYEKKNFAKAGVDLSFLRTGSVVYNQFNNPFIENLSIVDVMMFNPRHEINKMLDSYVLE